MIFLMKDSLQEVLLFIPLHQLTFLTPLPKNPIYYDSISEHIPNGWLGDATLLILHNEDEYKKLNEKNIANQLIQDSNLAGLVICIQDHFSIKENILTLFQQCLLPIIMIKDISLLHVFQQKNRLFCSYSQVSAELVWLMEKGFSALASELAFALGTPFLYLDENNQLQLQVGDEEALIEAKRWLNSHMKELDNSQYSNELVDTTETQNSKLKKKDSFEFYSINIAGMVKQTLVVSATLAPWQKKMVDKLVGLTALLLQTEGMFREQQEKFIEHFVYDLLYHKFESQTEMIKEGKTWGWNLEKPHHLLLINVELSNTLLTSIDWMSEIIWNFENEKKNLKEKMIVLPFQDQIVVLLEDEESRTVSERKKYIIGIADFLEHHLSNKWPQYHFYIGIGKWYQDTTNLNKSYQQAKLALQFGRLWYENRTVFHINDLGLIRLLTYIHQEILFDFCQDYLSVLEESDRQHGTEYFETLRVYIQHHGIITEVSDALHVHPNTLRNRLKKIEEITGVNLQNPEEFINLIVAVKILSLLKL